MSELLLELFSEEIPALMQKNVEEAYSGIFTKVLNENEISFRHLKVFIGPRRLSIYISDLPKIITRKGSEIKGPRIDAPASAIDGFCRSNNISLSALTTITIKDSLCYVYRRDAEEIDIKESFIRIIPEAINQYVWPKSMYWGDYSIKWVRPLQNILCIFDGEILPIKFGHLIGNNITYGHRFMSNGALEIQDFADYQKKLNEHYVILDRLERKELIKNQLEKIAREKSLNIKEDERLLDEVTGLVEFPVAMLGQIDNKFLKLPSEVLVASMRTHQKYFSLFYNNGNFAPYFLFVSNMKTDQNVIIKGNEKVLSARLSDALYFCDSDLKKGLENMGEGLKNLIFHDKLGTMHDQAERLQCKRTAAIQQDLYSKHLGFAASICKSDLVSEMVGEFPELQGIMGYFYYLRKYPEHESIASAIRDHYKPAGLNDDLPANELGVGLALRDKCDSLVGLMLAGERATGSSDSYGLRRLALGIIRLCTTSYNFDLKTYIENAIKEYRFQDNINGLLSDFQKKYPSEEFIESAMVKHAKKIILPFIEDRAKYYFKSQGYDIKVINAIIDFNKETNFSSIQFKLQQLTDFLLTEDGKDLLSVYKRIANITEDQEVSGSVNESYLLDNCEKELLKVFIRLLESSYNNQFDVIMGQLAHMLTPISNFFDNVLVMDPDPQIKNNRLVLLKNIKDLFNKVANFDAFL